MSRFARLLGEPHPEQPTAHGTYRWEDIRAGDAVRDAWAAQHLARKRLISLSYRMRRISRNVVHYRPHRRIAYRWHRSKHGWARPDAWSLDDYLAQLIGESVAWLRDHNHGHPCELTPEGWDDVLDRIAVPLLNYKSHWDYPDNEDSGTHCEREAKCMSDAQDALRLMADHFPSLWD